MTPRRLGHRIAERRCRFVYLPISAPWISRESARPLVLGLSRPLIVYVRVAEAALGEVRLDLWRTWVEARRVNGSGTVGAVRGLAAAGGGGRIRHGLPRAGCRR